MVAPTLTINDGLHNEVRLLGVGLGLLVCAPATRVTYANAVLLLSRFLWASGSSPETMTGRDFRNFRRWLNHCQQLPTNRKPPRPGSPEAALDITGHRSKSTSDQAQAAARTIYRRLEEDEFILETPVPPAAGSVALKGNNPLEVIQYNSGRQQNTGLASVGRTKPREVKPFPPDLRERILTDQDPRGAAMWRLMIESGPRSDEVRSLTPERIHLNESYIDVIGKGLGGATRWVPLSDDAADAYRAYVRFLASRGIVLETGVPVWRSMRSPHRPISYEGMRASFRNLIGPEEAERYTMHSLRHTAATSMLSELDLSIEKVQRILGHARIVSTQVYLHADQAEVTRQFSEAWRRGRSRPRLDLSGLLLPIPTRRTPRGSR